MAKKSTVSDGFGHSRDAGLTLRVRYTHIDPSA
jgi:hypothetical protein